ncbi:MAG: hypothetical protein NZ585_04220 [Chloracidobacterium sp.]|nr:hypothetical protein [Chloracidobacterium sp.]
MRWCRVFLRLSGWRGKLARQRRRGRCLETKRRSPLHRLSAPTPSPAPRPYRQRRLRLHPLRAQKHSVAVEAASIAALRHGHPGASPAGRHNLPAPSRSMP